MDLEDTDAAIERLHTLEANITQRVRRLGRLPA